jgi:hypothetical protein
VASDPQGSDPDLKEKAPVEGLFSWSFSKSYLPLPMHLPAALHLLGLGQPLQGLKLEAPLALAIMIGCFIALSLKS